MASARRRAWGSLNRDQILAAALNRPHRRAERADDPPPRHRPWRLTDGAPGAALAIPCHLGRWPEVRLACLALGSGPVQRMSCSHTNRRPSVQTVAAAREIGTPSQNTQLARLASHHDIRIPNRVRVAIVTRPAR